MQMLVAALALATVRDPYHWSYARTKRRETPAFDQRFEDLVDQDVAYGLLGFLRRVERSATKKTADNRTILRFDRDEFCADAPRELVSEPSLQRANARSSCSNVSMFQIER